jgi:hypothetical protein
MIDRFTTNDRYSNRDKRAPAHNLPSHDPDIPTPGCYRIRMARGGPPVALRIWLGPSIDPATGEEVSERGFRWQCAINGGQRVPFEDYWPGCGRDPISREEHDRIVAESRTMDEASHFYDPRRRIDPLRAPLPF